MGNTKLSTEKKTIEIMVGMYCQGHHDNSGGFCDECAEFLAYSHGRLDKCPFGEKKGPCSQCEVHCYKPAMREMAQEVMRYAGPRMMKKHPVLAVKHLCKEVKHKVMKHKKGGFDAQ